MKKVLAGCIILLIILSMGAVYATSDDNTAAISTNTTTDNSTEVLSGDASGELTNFKDQTTKELQDYAERYGSDTYGFTAYILNKVRIYSIPFCFLGIIVGAIYQYVIGIRKMDVRDKGFNLLIAFVTILIICQVLPLIFAIVVKGWRG